MSTFDGIVREFPSIRIDNFVLRSDEPPPLACFLSHVHSDHLQGLESFKSTFVYCTAQTRELLLRLERYPHRMNFAKGILESRKQTYRRLKNHIKPIPLETPTVIELAPANSIRVTLFDANHCLGSCMFLIEDEKKAILYTGDIRSEQWWVNSLIRNPVLIPFTKGHRRLDNLYLDTTFIGDGALEYEFPSKAEGLNELLDKVLKYPQDTIFYFNTWTFGYEEVWVALCAALRTQVHLDSYRWRLYQSQRDQPTCFGPQISSLVGFKLGNHEHPGCLTSSPEGVRIHSCERGTHCDVFKNPNVVYITPMIARHKGQEIAEVGAGGGQGDLDQIHSLELYDQATINQLGTLCAKVLRTEPQLQSQILQWFTKMMKVGGQSVKLDVETLRDEAHVDGENGESMDEYDLDDLPLDRLVPALARLIGGKPKEKDSPPQDRHVTFPYSRHSSYQEIRELVEAFRPKDVFPCTVDLTTYTTDLSMEMLFGDLCSANLFQADKDIFTQLGIPASDSPNGQETQRPTQPPPNDADLLSAGASALVHEPEWTVQKTTSASKAHNVEAISFKTPEKRPKRLFPERETPRSTASERSARRTRAWNGALGIEGQTWEGLTSVSGYHNQDIEKEL